MNDKNIISPEAWKRLKREHAYLDAARTLFKQADDDALIQMAFAENQDAGDSIGVIRQFVALVDVGTTPPPHILAAVAVGFREYLAANGGQSIDDAFGFEKKQGKKNPLAQQIKKEQRGTVFYFIWRRIQQEKREGKRMTVLAAANEAKRHFGLHTGAAALEQEYSKTKVARVYDDALKILNDEFRKTSVRKNP